ncbi:hypothetical protein EZV73_00805 [Acidaminobacter sp. JC074]|uniref:DUF7674 family protein n=1 Tax=Acidaminobacter sp. JC074 TaxID=2530199 RepID=UPI001F1040C6|nr:hypothetical protein [Acidaminobacter sp. JC074]MCH4886080.1 hypothetical protein [Acidaminobacter sp. JC074]
MRKMDYFIDMYVQTFPDQKRKIDEHIQLNGMFLGHIFFDEEICGPLCQKLRDARTTEEVKKLVTIVEAMLLEGDDYVRSIVTMNVLKMLKQDRGIVEKAKVHFSDQIIEKIEAEMKVG